MGNSGLAQPYEQMFERNVGHIAKRGREVSVWIDGQPEPRVGFLAGLDDEYLQVCITKTQTLSNIKRDMISSVDETGLTLGALIRDSRGTDFEEAATKIEKKVGALQKKATSVFGSTR